jgi:hypothetical protein
MKVLCFIIGVLILLWFVNRPISTYVAAYSNDFPGICPPGQMPASYTAAGGRCVPTGEEIEFR